MISFESFTDAVLSSLDQYGCFIGRSSSVKIEKLQDYKRRLDEKIKNGFNVTQYEEFIWIA